MSSVGAAELEQSAGILPTELAVSLIHLLECATRHLDEDRGKAKASRTGFSPPPSILRLRGPWEPVRVRAPDAC